MNADRPARPFRYGWLVGVVFVVVVVIAGINMLRTTDSGIVGIGQVGVGEKVAPFAVPLAGSDLDGDANIDPDRACEITGRDVLRICDYFGKPLVISFWFTRRASECIAQQDVFNRVAERFRGRVGMVSVNVRDDRDRVRDLIREHGWTMPVGYDRDGAVSNIYRVGGCPTFLFVNPDGTLERAQIGRTTTLRLAAQVRSLFHGSAETQDETGAGKAGADD